MTLPTDQQEQYISIWAKAVDTQMHFNEMSVKSRQLGLTFVAAALGIGVVLASRGDDFAFTVPLGGHQFRLHITVLLVLGAWLALIAVRTLDLNVYHKMLRGAVTFGEDFEEHYMKQIFDLEKGMTQTVSHYSRSSNAGKERGPDRKYRYTGGDDVSAEKKIREFYKNTIVFLWFAAGAMLLITNAKPLSELSWSGKPVAEQSSPKSAVPKATENAKQ